MIKLVRITTVPLSLDKLLTGQMRFFRLQGMEVSMVSSGGELVGKIVEREGCPHYAIPMTRTIAPFKDIISLIRLIGLLRRLKPDVVHTETPKAGLLGMMASWWCRVPVRIHTIAGLPLTESRGVKKLLLIQTEKCTYWFATHVYPNSEGLRRYVLDHRLIPPNRLFFIGNGTSNGVDTHYFKRRESLLMEGRNVRNASGIPDKSFVYIFVGRIVKDKGINELCAAFQSMSARYSNIELLLVGPFENDLDPISDESNKIIAENPHIHTFGFQDDVRPFLIAADVLVFPSYREGFPNVPLQAGCLDLPCIVTDINGCTDTITQEVNGLIIPAKNTQALEGAMERMLEDDQLRITCGNNARVMASSRFDCEKVWELLLEAYTSFLKLTINGPAIR